MIAVEPGGEQARGKPLGPLTRRVKKTTVKKGRSGFKKKRKKDPR